MTWSVRLFLWSHPRTLHPPSSNVKLGLGKNLAKKKCQMTRIFFNNMTLPNYTIAEPSSVACAADGCSRNAAAHQCAGCPATYCSSACQVAAWSEHRKTCRRFILDRPELQPDLETIKAGGSMRAESTRVVRKRVLDRLVVMTAFGDDRLTRDLFYQRIRRRLFPAHQANADRKRAATPKRIIRWTQSGTQSGMLPRSAGSRIPRIRRRHAARSMSPRRRRRLACVSFNRG